MQKTIELLKALNKQGIKPKLWLRDDDICTDSPNFRLLLQLAPLGFPMVFAAVPYRLKFSDAELTFVRSLPKNVYFCVHGFNHIKRSESGHTSEFPDTVGLKQAQKELAYGYNKVKSLFPERFLAMFVPPWNHIADVHIPQLVEQDYQYLSGTIDTTLETSETPLRNLPSHVDVLAYGDDIWFPLKAETQIDNELHHALLNWKKAGDVDLPLCVLSHHTSMFSKHIAHYKELIVKIAPYCNSDSFDFGNVGFD